MTAAEVSRQLDRALHRSPAIDRLEIGPGAIESAGRLFRDLFDGAPARLFADDNTWAAAGEPVAASLQAAGVRVDRDVLAADPRIKPDRALGADLARRLRPDEIPVAIGSGVLNDLVKYAAFERERRYLCVATAASMDGYTSAGAPLSQDGFKKTLQCRPPRAVIGDTAVLADAPREMLGWGFGDMAGKMPAGADWIVADALGIEPVDAVAWPMVQDNLRHWLDGAEAVGAADETALAGLFAGLALVGLAMEAHGSSRPASGADHQIAHLWEMEGLHRDGVPVSHGACVSVGCVAALRLYDWTLGQDFADLDADAAISAAPEMHAKRCSIRGLLGDGEIAERAAAETEAKHLSRAAHRERLARLASVWPDLAARLQAHLMSPAEMAERLRAARAPVAGDEIGVAAAHMARSLRAAVYLRQRYTILDLLAETGRLDAAIEATVGTAAGATRGTGP